MKDHRMTKKNICHVIWPSLDYLIKIKNIADGWFQEHNQFIIYYNKHGLKPK